MRAPRAATPPSAASNSRRPMVTVIRPSRARCVKGRIPRHERPVLTARRGRGHDHSLTRTEPRGLGFSSLSKRARESDAPRLISRLARGVAWPTFPRRVQDDHLPICGALCRGSGSSGVSPSASPTSCGRCSTGMASLSQNLRKWRRVVLRSANRDRPCQMLERSVKAERFKREDPASLRQSACGPDAAICSSRS